jgi:hypothetical protein
MDIAALSAGLSQIKLQSDVGIALTKKAMDVSQTQSNELLQMLNTSVPAPQPTSSRFIDVKV